MPILAADAVALLFHQLTTINPKVAMELITELTMDQNVSRLQPATVQDQQTQAILPVTAQEPLVTLLVSQSLILLPQPVHVSMLPTTLQSNHILTVLVALSKNHNQKYARTTNLAPTALLSTTLSDAVHALENPIHPPMPLSLPPETSPSLMPAVLATVPQPTMDSEPAIAAVKSQDQPTTLETTLKATTPTMETTLKVTTPTTPTTVTTPTTLLARTSKLAHVLTSPSMFPWSSMAPTETLQS